ncbi:hypothetical protein LXL04_015650 [Taraxacum kok-saghyz]
MDLPVEGQMNYPSGQAIICPKKGCLLKSIDNDIFYQTLMPTLIIWDEHDRLFPLELGERLKGHLGEDAKLVILKNAGHAINAEKPKELYKN